MPCLVGTGLNGGGKLHGIIWGWFSGYRALVIFTLQVLEKGKALYGHALDRTGFETWCHSLLAGLLWASTEAHCASMSSSIKWG